VRATAEAMNRALEGTAGAAGQARRDFSLEVAALSKTFGRLKALDNVSLRLRRGSIHALLGENGAGKSTLVKCVMGYQPADEGGVIVDGRERTIRSTRDAHTLGLGMVYQHFTLVPAMTVLENLVLAKAHLPALINWREARRRIDTVMADMPFRVDLDRRVATLAAGEKQKVEILKQLLLDRRILILDEPSSVLTPDEADEVLGNLRRRVTEHDLSVLLITHKMREVMAYADEVTVLRQGRRVATGAVAGHDPDSLVSAMMGEATVATAAKNTRRETGYATAALTIRDLVVTGDRGTRAVDGLSLTVRPGEIVGVAGVSGNGQRELVEALNGQRPIDSGAVLIGEEAFVPTRRAMTRHRFRCLPEEPLHNACVADMTVAENLSLRRFDHPDMTRARWLLNRGAQRRLARSAIRDYDIRTQSTEAMLRDLSGGNVQRTVLARELQDEPRYLVVANPCFGLDFAAAAQIRNRLVEARDRGAAVLLLSEDLDEVLDLSDRIVVLFAGRIVHDVRGDRAGRAEIGRHMAGQR
jgi:simple sugar transport system ATP-binding protein